MFLKLFEKSYSHEEYVRDEAGKDVCNLTERLDLNAPIIYRTEHKTYCPFCKTDDMHYEGRLVEYIEKKDKYLYSEYFTCQSCGKKSYFMENRFFDSDSNFTGDTDKFTLAESLYISNPYPDLSLKNKEVITYDDKSKKLAIFASFTQICPFKKLIKQNFYYKLILNLKTKKTYFIGPKTKEKKAAFGYSGPVVMNISGLEGPVYMFSEIFSDEGIDRLFSEYISLSGQHDFFTGAGPEAGYDRVGNYYTTRSGKLSYITLMNTYYYSCVEKDYHTKELKYHFLDKSCLYSSKMRKAFISDTYTDYPSLIRKAAKKLGIPTGKSFLRMYDEDIRNVAYVSGLMENGFKDENCIRSLIENGAVSWLLCGRNFSDAKLIKRMIRLKGEVVTSRRIISLSERQWVIRDAINMYSNIKDMDASLLPEIANYNIEELHDILAKTFNKLKYANREIPYSEAERLLEDSINGFEISLAKDTYELINVGTEMGICVGGYGEAAFSKQCTILTFKKGGKYAACIELHKHGRNFELMQAKGKYNKFLTGQTAIALKIWINRHSIEKERCYDFNKLDTETDSETDYHRIELVDGEIVAA